MGDTIIGYPFVSLYFHRLYSIAGWNILDPEIIEKPGLIPKYLSAEADFSVKKIHMDAEYFEVFLKRG